MALAIHPVTRSTLPVFHAAMRHLSEDLGDDHRADLAALDRALFGPCAICLGLLAARAERPLGAVLAAPIFSTMRGGPGLYVSDLWVAAAERGRGLARRMLAELLRQDEAHFIKLAVYDDNPDAHAAYLRLGFEPQTRENAMILHGDSLVELRER